MSTKSTIKYGDTFHLYHEALDMDKVYLEIEMPKFMEVIKEVDHLRVVVSIDNKTAKALGLIKSYKTPSQIKKIMADWPKRLERLTKAFQKSKKCPSGSLADPVEKLTKAFKGRKKDVQ